MTNVIHHDYTHRSGSNVASLVGIILAIAVILFFFYYFVGGFNGTQPQINVPDRVNVDVNQNP